MSDCDRLLARLRQGPATSAELYGMAMIVHSRVSDLRNLGHVIEKTRIKGEVGAASFLYSLTYDAGRVLSDAGMPSGRSRGTDAGTEAGPASLSSPGGRGLPGVSKTDAGQVHGADAVCAQCNGSMEGLYVQRAYCSNRCRQKAARARWGDEYRETERVRMRIRDYTEAPEKKRARNAVSEAKRNGTLVEQPCEVCGALPTEAHHDDYSRPLDVRWLCRDHHELEHHPLHQSPGDTTAAAAMVPHADDLGRSCHSEPGIPLGQLSLLGPVAA